MLQFPTPFPNYTVFIHILAGFLWEKWNFQVPIPDTDF